MSTPEVEVTVCKVVGNNIAVEVGVKDVVRGVKVVGGVGVVGGGVGVGVWVFTAAGALVDVVVPAEDSVDDVVSA